MSLSAEQLAVRKSRIQLLLLTGVFVFPIALGSLWFYFAQALAPEGRTNEGLLLAPVVELKRQEPELSDELPQKWSLILFQDGACEADCQLQQYNLQQLHLASGKYHDRIQKVLLFGKQFDPQQIPAEGWISLGISDENLLNTLQQRSGPDYSIFIADPHANIMLGYPAATAPGKVWHDLKKMLKVSRIG